MKQLLFACYLLNIGVLELSAQQGVVACGVDISGSGGSVSYSIGQIDYMVLYGSGGQANQGIQQPHDNLITSIEENGNAINAYLAPNPTTDLVVLSVENISEHQELKYMLYDEKGRIIVSQKMEGTQVLISTEELTGGYYFVKLYTDKEDLKIFKIIRQ